SFYPGRHVRQGSVLAHPARDAHSPDGVGAHPDHAGRPAPARRRDDARGVTADRRRALRVHPGRPPPGLRRGPPDPTAASVPRAPDSRRRAGRCASGARSRLRRGRACLRGDRRASSPGRAARRCEHGHDVSAGPRTYAVRHMAFKRSGVRLSSPLLPFRMVRTRSTQRRLDGGTVSPARKLEYPRVSVGCPYTGLIRGHRVRQRPPGSLRFFTHVMGRDGVGNALKVNRTLEVGGSTPLGSTYDSALWPMSAGACTRFWKRADVFQLRAAMKSPRRCGSSKSSGGERVPSNWPSTCSKKGGAEDERRPRKMSRRTSPWLRLSRVRRARYVRGTVLPIDGGYLTCPAG